MTCPQHVKQLRSPTAPPRHVTWNPVQYGTGPRTIPGPGVKIGPAPMCSFVGERGPPGHQPLAHRSHGVDVRPKVDVLFRGHKRHKRPVCVGRRGPSHPGRSARSGTQHRPGVGGIPPLHRPAPSTASGGRRSCHARAGRSPLIELASRQRITPVALVATGVSPSSRAGNVSRMS